MCVCVCVCVYVYIHTYIFVIIKDMGHYDYNSQRFDDYGICNYSTKNTTNDLCDKFVCIIVTVVILVVIFSIFYRGEDEGE